MGWRRRLHEILARHSTPELQTLRTKIAPPPGLVGFTLAPGEAINLDIRTDMDGRPRYALVHYRERVGILCVACDLTSWNEHDVEARYCDGCKHFHEHERMRRALTTLDGDHVSPN
jgi:hypothetical protein